MKRAPRDPLRHDSLDLLERYVLQKGRPSHGEEVDGFLTELRSSLENVLDNPSFLHGKRTEAMFEMIVASLGSVRLLKQEDSGDLFYDSSNEISAPDFRLILSTGEQCLVEVKNFYQKQAFSEYRMSLDYVASLRRYADAMGCRLLFAIYWAKWNAWTLVDEVRLKVFQQNRVITFGESQMFNEMAIVGDKMIGTRSPIHFRFLVESKKKNKDGSEQLVTIKSADLFSEDRMLTRSDEKHFAIFLLLYGRWLEREVVETDDDGLITSVNFFYSPDAEEDMSEKQGFSIVGTLSGMLSRQYASKTLKHKKVSRVRGAYRPGEASGLIPERDSISQLPLWILTQSPKQDENYSA